MAQPFLSVIIPAYNEQARISQTLEQVIEYLAGRDYPWEVVVADDGSTDGTAQAVSERTRSSGGVRLLQLSHRGKGWAVKNGMLAASGRFRLLCDADLSVPIRLVERLLEALEGGAAVAAGSREAAGAQRIGEPSRRHLMGRVYNFLVRRLAVTGLGDTQCGFKCFAAEAAEGLFRSQTMDGFAFDVELLYLARKRGMKVAEVGVDWYYQEHSKVRPVRDSLAMTWDLIKIRWRHRGAADSAVSDAKQTG